MSRGPKHGSGKRSGAYAESKYTNWMPYKPVYAEIKLIPPRHVPSADFELPDGARIPIVQRPLYREFVRPCSIEDLVDFLAKVPFQFLIGLKGIYLLGGTAKQLRGAPLPDGVYNPDDQRIYLMAWRRADLNRFWTTLPKPHCLNEYKSSGAKIERVKGGWELRFDQESLRRYVLNIVLLHEIGHHIERHEKRDHQSSENFAEWMVQEIAKKMK